MQRMSCLALALSCLLIVSTPATKAGDDAKPLQGVWIAQSLEVDGKPAPAEAFKQMKFTFKGDKLLVVGNFKDGREEECEYKIDPKQSPKHLTFTPPKQKDAVLGIYEIKGDDLKICMRHVTSTAGRPTEFSTKADSKLILITFKRQKP